MANRPCLEPAQSSYLKPSLRTVEQDLHNAVVDVEDLALAFRDEAPAVRARIERLDKTLLHANRLALALPFETLVEIFKTANSRDRICSVPNG